MTESEAEIGASGATPDEFAPQETVPPAPVMAGKGAQRIASLDFIRGIAVLGILAANIVAFGQPFTAYMYPDAFLTPHGEVSGWMWVAQFVIIDGKMRGLFTLLFGAGMMLFMERAWARGSSRWLQVRRLLWLGLFGLCHFFFIWKGDILFMYAVAGLVALLFVKLERRNQFILGMIGYVFGGLIYLAMAGSMVLGSSGNFGEGAAAQEMQEGMMSAKYEDVEESLIDGDLIASGDYAGMVAHNFTDHVGDLGFVLMLFWMETLPLMLIGMALFRKGLFSGGLDARKQRLWGWAGLAVGAALSLWIALAARDEGFNYYGTMAAFLGWSFFPRLLMVLGLAALLGLWGMTASGWLAQRLSAAGRAAFTNYIGTSVLMMLVFHGWAGGLYGDLNRPQLYLVVLGAWAVMLLWSKPWLERFRYGPLEWLWRCLTYGRLFPLRR